MLLDFIIPSAHAAAVVDRDALKEVGFKNLIDAKNTMSDIGAPLDITKKGKDVVISFPDLSPDQKNSVRGQIRGSSISPRGKSILNQILTNGDRSGQHRIKF